MLKSKEKLYKEILEKDRQIIEKNETIDRIYTQYLNLKDIVREEQDKIDKAIEYIKLASNKFEYLDTEETKELLKILGDKENE